MYMLCVKGYGLGMDDILWSCPKDMEPYLNAFKIEREVADTDAWVIGQYVMHAIDVVADRIISGMSKKKSSAKYLEKPLHLMYKEENKTDELSEEEKIRQTELLFMKLKVMQSNFERSHSKNE